MNIFELNDYRQILRTSLLRKKEQHGKPFTFQALAKACRVQKAYLSKVLRGVGHLNDDQTYLACEFLGFNAAEREFVALLQARERCDVAPRKRELNERIEKTRSRNLQTDAHLQLKTMPAQSAELLDYYLDPATQLVHMFLTVPRYAKEPDRIARDVGYTKRQLADALDRLLRLGIVRFEAGAYQVLRDNLHLTPGTRTFETYRTLMRLKAIEQIPRAAPEDTYNFAVVFSADDASRASIQARALEMIRATESLVRKAPQEDVYQMTFDLFKWSQSGR